MASRPDPRNVMRGLRVPRDLDAKILKKYGRGGGEAVKDAYIRALERAAFGVKLSPADLRRIDADTREAVQRVWEKRAKGTVAEDGLG